MRYFKLKIFLLMSLWASVLVGCNEMRNSGGQTGGNNFYLSVRAYSTSINEDIVLWEDRVDELRMLAFDPDDGTVVINQKLYFPDGFTGRSRAVQMHPGTYDFYFIANETVYPDAFTTALTNITNVSQFTSDPRFTNIIYDPSFIPDGTSVDGRFLMSAVYTGITLATGGTETNPVLLPLPTSKVELIRNLAKVEVVFRKKVAGSSLPENTITSVQLMNVPSVFSVPPLDEYYNGSTISTGPALIDGFDYSRDSIGSVRFYIPEFLLPTGSTEYTELHINNQSYPIENDPDRAGLTEQRRTVPELSDNSVIRNYHYLVNAYINTDGGIQIMVEVEPWTKDSYVIIIQGDQQITIPPVIPTDTSIIIPTECGKIEILSHNEQLSEGLQGAYNDEIIYWDPEIQGPRIQRGDPPYYCEKKYGPGWRLINSCELLSFLAYFDVAYRVWMSNTWLAANNSVPYYPIHFRQEAQGLLEKITGFDLSGTVLYPENNWLDEMDDNKLDIIDRFFTPGDIMLRIDDFPGGWPFEAPPGTTETWYYNEVTIQVKAFWYGEEYISLADRNNWDRVLYGEFERYDYSSTVSRCVREVD